MTTDKPNELREGTTACVQQPQSPGSCSVLVRVHDVSSSPQERILKCGGIVIGAGLGSDIIINDSSVSRRHLQLTVTNGEIEITDLASRNGTFYQGQRVGRLSLNREATISLGRIRVSIIPQISAKSLVDADAARYGSLVGDSPFMLQLFSTLQRLEDSVSPVLLEGESGTGKEHLARAIHEHSPAQQGQFVAVYCGERDRALMRSHLYGHGPSLVAGAAKEHGGAIEKAAGGTLFLDDVSDLPLDVQALLLRTLETQDVVLGKTQERNMSVRVIAATALPLAKRVAEGTFRSDLLHRLSTVALPLLPLRERRGDIRLLARHFASEYGVVRLPPQVIEQLELHDWGGNVLELRNVIRGYAAIGELPQAPVQEDEHLAEMLHRVLNIKQPYQVQKDHLLNEFIDVYLSMLLESTRGNQTEAARVSGIDRAHLNKMIAKLRRGSSRPPPQP